jgi:GAF domain-containing protein
MLERGHRLRVGQSGIVGYVSAFGKARIALDVGKDAAFFNNPDLPQTHSEVALPLKLRGKTIGVLDIQSIEPIAFTDEDIDTLSLLAGQIAVTIQNSRLFEDTQQALREAQTIYGEAARSSWQEFRGEGVTGFRYSKGAIKALSSGGEPEADEKGEVEGLSIPIKVRGEELGQMKIQAPGRSGEWSESEIQFYRAVVERLSFAIENARLIEETTKSAQRDRTITAIADKLGSSPLIEEILRTAAEELSRAIKGTEVLVQLRPASENASQE